MYYFLLHYPMCIKNAFFVLLCLIICNGLFTDGRHVTLKDEAGLQRWWYLNGQQRPGKQIGWQLLHLRLPSFVIIHCVGLYFTKHYYWISLRWSGILSSLSSLLLNALLVWCQSIILRYSWQERIPPDEASTWIITLRASVITVMNFYQKVSFAIWNDK